MGVTYVDLLKAMGDYLEGAGVTIERELQNSRTGTPAKVKCSYNGKVIASETFTDAPYGAYQRVYLKAMAKFGIGLPQEETKPSFTEEYEKQLDAMRVFQQNIEAAKENGELVEKIDLLIRDFSERIDLLPF